MENLDSMHSMDSVTEDIINNVLKLSLYVNTTLISMFLTSLTMQKYSPVTTSVFKDEYDFVIAGASSAGSVLAARLSELPCINVLLLEAGSSPPLGAEVPAFDTLLSAPQLLWPYTTVPQKHSAIGTINNTLKYEMGKVIGGFSSLNGMPYVRGNAKDYDDWAASGALGWSYNDVLPYFKKMEHNFNPHSVDKEFHGFYGPMSVMEQPYNSEVATAFLNAGSVLGYPIVDYNGRQQTGFSRTQYNMKNGQRCSAAKAYLAEADSRSNLRIVKDAFITKVIIHNRKAIGVEFDSNLGRGRKVYAKREVILSAGALNTPKLLMLSGIGPKEELMKFQIPLQADLPVGLNFHDHPSVAMPYRMNGATSRQRLQNECQLKDYIVDRKGPYSASVEAASGFLNIDKDFSEDAKSDYQLIMLDDTNSYIRGFNVKHEIYEKVFAPHDNERVLWCGAYLMHPRSRGTIKLRSSHPYDMPLIDPNFFSDPRDLRELVEAMKECNRITDTHPMKRIGVERWTEKYPGCEVFIKDSHEYLECQARLLTNNGYHPVGSAKMGHPEDPETVVDPKLRVKGIKGLRVVDASIMPQIVSGDTINPVIMIGEKAADIIKETICCTSCEGKDCNDLRDSSS